MKKIAGGIKPASRKLNKTRISGFFVAQKFIRKRIAGTPPGAKKKYVRGILKYVRHISKYKAHIFGPS